VVIVKQNNDENRILPCIDGHEFECVSKLSCLQIIC